MFVSALQSVGAGMKESAVLIAALQKVGAGMKESAVFVTALPSVGGSRDVGESSVNSSAPI